MNKKCYLKKYFKKISLAMSIGLFFIGSSSWANETLTQMKAMVHARQMSQETNAVIPIAQPDYIKINPDVYRLKAHDVFVLFYRSTCPHCQRFDPVLKQVSDQTKIPVIAFTTDGIALPAFPNSRAINQDVITHFFGENTDIKVPTLFILNRLNGNAYPVSEGELNILDLIHRLNELAPKIWQYEENKNV